MEGPTPQTLLPSNHTLYFARVDTGVVARIFQEIHQNSPNIGECPLNLPPDREWTYETLCKSEYTSEIHKINEFLLKYGVFPIGHMPHSCIGAKNIGILATAPLQIGSLTQNFQILPSSSRAATHREGKELLSREASSDLDSLGGSLSSISSELEYAEQLAREVLTALESHVDVNIPSLKEKIQGACELYDGVPSENQTNKRQLLQKWRIALFHYTKKRCTRRDLVDLGTFGSKMQHPEFVGTLPKLLSTYVEKIPENWDRENIAVSDRLETSLFLIAFMCELLNHREESVKRYFQLAEYHSIVARQDLKDRSLMIEASLAKARSLEAPKDKVAKARLIHSKFVEILGGIRTMSACDPFSCFICYDASEETEEWVSKFLYRDLFALNIHPVFRARSQKIGQHPVDFGKKIRGAKVVLVLCTTQMKENYDRYLRGMSNASLGIELEFLKDRYLSGKELKNTYHLQLGQNWDEIAFSRLPDFFQRKDFVYIAESSMAPYSNYLNYFENAIHLFCDILEIPEHLKVNYKEEFLRFVSDIENRPVTREENERAEEFFKMQQTLPPLPLLPDPSKNSTQLIGVPNIGRDFQDREGISLGTLFKNTGRIVFTQDPSIICGTGKTYLAAQYAHEFGSKYNYVIWVDGKSKETLDDSLGKAIEKVQKKAPNVQDVKSLVEWAEKAPGILLIFDHISNLEILNSYLPGSQSSTHVLVTTRLEKWPDSWQVTSLSLLTPNEGKKLLTKITKKQEEKPSTEIVASLEGIPSLISQAGYLLKGTSDAPSLYKTILESETASKKRNLANRSNLPYISPHFSGRKLYLAAINEAFSSNSSSTIILTGGLGIGKTSIAHQYALDNVHQFKLIWNLPFSDPNRLRASISDLKIYLGMPLEKQEEDLLTSIKEIYQAIEKQEGKTLLVFDDLSLEDKHLLPSFPALNLSVLVTSKDGGWEGHVLPVKPFSKVDALLILKKFLKDEEAHFLADSLDLFMDNPLALLQAAHTIKKREINPQNYLKDLTASIGEKKDLKSLFAALWKETEKSLIQRPRIDREVCLSLAKLCACSQNQIIPEKRLEDWLKKNLKEELDPETDPIHIVLRDYLTELKEFLIIEEKNGLVFIQPLVAEGIKSNMAEKELAKYY